MGESGPRCGTHPEAPAGWRCTRCGEALCPDCTALRPTGSGAMEVCGRCGGSAETVRLPRAQVQPFVARLKGAFTWPFSPQGLFALFAAAVFLWLARFLGSMAAGIAAGVILAYRFQVVRHTAGGGDDFPGPDDFRGVFDDVVAPAWRMTMAGVWILAPLLVVWMVAAQAPPPSPAVEERPPAEEEAKAGPGEPPALEDAEEDPPTDGVALAEAAPPRHDVEGWRAPPVPPPEPPPSRGRRLLGLLGGLAMGERPPVPAWGWLLVGVGALAYPMAVVAAALQTPMFTILNPLMVIGLAVRTGADYGLCALVFLFLELAQAGLARVIGPLAHRVPLGGLVEAFVLLFVPFLQMRVIGLLVRVRGDDLGYGSPDFYLEPVLGAARPRLPLEKVQPPPRVEAAPAPPRPPVVPLELGPADDAPVEVRLERQPPSRSPEELRAAPDPLAGTDLARRVGQDDLAGALALLHEQRQVAAQTLAAPAWISLGKAAAEARRADLALLAFKRATEVAPEGPHAPQAWLLAARVADQLGQDRARSDRLLQELARRFPQTAEGQFAAKRLGIAGP